MQRFVPVTLDRPRRFRYTLTSFMALDQDVRRLLGCPFQEAFERWYLTVGPYLVLHGLRHEDPKLTFDRVEALLQNCVDADGDVSRVYEKASMALRLSGVLGIKAAEGADAERVAAEAAAVDAPAPDVA